MPTNEQIVDDLTTLIELHEERVARGADHGARDLAESVLTMLGAAGRLIPEGAAWEFLLREPGCEPGGPVRKSREEILGDVEYVSRRWGPREAVGRVVGPWVEVSGE